MVLRYQALVRSAVTLDALVDQVVGSTLQAREPGASCGLGSFASPSSLMTS